MGIFRVYAEDCELWQKIAYIIKQTLQSQFDTNLYRIKNSGQRLMHVKILLDIRYEVNLKQQTRNEAIIEIAHHNITILPVDSIWTVNLTTPVASLICTVAGGFTLTFAVPSG
jgi:hypothetical protein